MVTTFRAFASFVQHIFHKQIFPDCFLCIENFQGATNETMLQKPLLVVCEVFFIAVLS